MSNLGQLIRPRIVQLMLDICNRIPCLNPKSRIELARMDLTRLLMRYTNWADRLIVPRLRKVLIWDGFWRHGNPNSHIEDIFAIARDIECGANLRPYLSEKIATHGYVVRDKAYKKGIIWYDKDYVLNVFDIHHLHLKQNKRTNNLLFVHFSRNAASLVMAGDHKSFDDGTLADAIAEARVGSTYELRGLSASPDPLSANDRNRLARSGFTTCVDTGGTTVLGASLSTAGTSLWHTHHAGRLARIILQVDPKLNDTTFVLGLFSEIGIEMPDEPIFRWKLEGCDLYLTELISNSGFIFEKWKR